MVDIPILAGKRDGGSAKKLGSLIFASDEVHPGQFVHRGRAESGRGVFAPVDGSTQCVDRFGKLTAKAPKTRKHPRQSQLLARVTGVDEECQGGAVVGILPFEAFEETAHPCAEAVPSL